MTEARITPLSPEEARKRAVEAGCPEGLGDLAVFQVLFRRPQAARALNGMLTALLFKGTLDPKVRELIIMRIAWVTGAGYEWSHHWDFALRVGHDPATVAALADWENATCFSAEERAALKAADDVLATGDIEEPTWSECRTLFDEDLLVELVAVIANWRLFATLLVTLRIPLETGRAVWPPNGQGPTAN
jgi:alkylhydroperoxidase family enzyme